MKSKKHIGSSFDSFLDENKITAEVEELASCKFLEFKDRKKQAVKVACRKSKSKKI